MAGGAFTIQELDPSGGPVGRPFSWDAKHFNAPRPDWQFGIRLRTVREDYPGSTEPTEQVLGWSYKDFTVTGVWDDRYNSVGYAAQTLEDFEAQFQRGKRARFEFDRITVTGLIKEADFRYKRANYVPFSFVVSPHFRRKPSEQQKTADAKRYRSPDEVHAQLTAIASQMLARHNAALPLKLKGTILSDIVGATDKAFSKVAELRSLIDNRIFGTTSGITGTTAGGPIAGFGSLGDLRKAFARISANLSSTQSLARDIITQTRQLKSDTSISYETAMGTLDLEDWGRNTARDARVLFLSSREASQEFARRAHPTAQVLYHPRTGESLYAISKRFYNTPYAWQSIAERNNLSKFVFTGTEVLVIPEAR